MLITTSRYSSQTTRGFAKSLAKLLGCKYIARGKKAVDSLASFARKNGDDKICIVVEKSSLPVRLEFINIKANATWAWEKEMVEITHDESG